MAIAPISGWVLDRIANDLDRARAGFAGFYLRASDERRQVVAAFLSVSPLNEATEKESASLLMEAGHHAILHIAFGTVPTGFRAALGRSGAQAHAATYYRDLFKMLSDGQPHIITAIQRLPALTPERLLVMGELPTDLCDARIVYRIKDAGHASDLILAADLLEKRGVSRHAVVEALCQSVNLNETIKRWSFRMPFPKGPIPACSGYRPITNGVELRKIALKYRNCVRGYLSAAMAGDHAFGEFTANGHDVLISYDRAGGLWIADGVHGRSNLAVHAELSKEAFAFAGRHGIPDRRSSNRTDKAVEALRRLSRFYVDWDAE